MRGILKYTGLFTAALWLHIQYASGAVIITLTATPGRCPSSGSITVTATGTSGTVLYAIKKSTDPVFSTEQTSNIFPNLVSGSYTVSVHDASGVYLSTPQTLTNATYTVMSISSVVSGNILVTACNPDGSIELTMTGGRSPYTYHLRSGPTIKPDVVDTPGTRVRFTQLESGNYFIDITDSCRNILTQSTAIVVRSLYNLKDTILGSVDGMNGPLQYGGNCVDSLSFSTNNILLKSVNGTVLFQRDLKTMPSGYPMQGRVLYPNGAVTDTTPWQSVFGKFPLPNYSPDSTKNKYRVQLRHPCNDTNIVTSPEYIIPYPYQTRSGYCLPSLVHATPGYHCGTVNIHLVDIANSSNVRDYTWDGIASSFTFDTTGWGITKFYAFITIGSNTYQTNNVTAGKLLAVTVATDSWDFPSSIYCDFSTGRMRSYISTAPPDNTVPITYSILSGPELRDPVTSTEPLPVFIWDTLQRGTYSIKVDYGGCRSDILTRIIAPPYTGFAADSLSYRLGSSCGKYVITGKGWYIDTLGVPVTDTLEENDTLLGLTPGLRQYTARFLNSNGTFGLSSPNTYSTQPFAITGAGEVVPGTYRIVFMSASNSQNHCYYQERSITIPPYVPVIVDVANSGGVACDSLTGDIYVGTQGGSITISTGGSSSRPLSYRIKPRDSTDAAYTPYQSSPVFPNQPVGIYTAQVFDSCGYTATADIELVGRATTPAIDVIGATLTATDTSVCQLNDALLKLKIIGTATNVTWFPPVGDSLVSDTYTINNFQSTDAGKYFVKYTSGGCPRRDSVTLNYHEAPTYTVSGTTAICDGSSIDLTSIVTNISPNSTVSFYSDTSVTVQVFNTNVNPTITTNYYIQSADNATGCKSLVTPISITVNDPPIIGIVVAPPPVCEGQSLAVTVPTVTEQGSPVTNQGWILNGNTFDISVPLLAIQNGVQVSYFAESACGTTISPPITVTVYTKPEFTYNSPILSINPVDLTTIPLSAGDITGLTQKYYDSAYNELSGTDITAADPGTYHIIGINANGCSDTSTVVISFGIPLPVGLLYFNATRDGDNALLTWATSFEQNSRRFEIEQSTNGVNFIKIGELPARGNSSVQVNYSYTDSNICRYNAGRIYYRLKQVDNDGSYKIYGIKTIKGDCNQKELFVIVPNPARENIYIKGITGMAGIRVFNSHGQLLMTKQNIRTPDLINTSQLPAGMYTVQIIRAGNIIASIKFIKE